MARDFNGTTADYLVNTASAPLGAYPYTLAAFVNVDSIVNGMTFLGCYDKDASGDRFHAGMGGGSSGTCVHTLNSGGSSDFATSSNFVMVTTGWQHVAVVGFNATDRKAYVGGTQVAASVGNKTFPTAVDSMAIGILANSAPSSPTDGQIASAAIWNIDLHTGELTALSRGVPPTLIRRGNLVFYAPLLGTGSPERDYTVGQRHLTVNGTVVQSSHPPVAMPFGG